jgi:hypothetical protein
VVDDELPPVFVAPPPPDPLTIDRKTTTTAISARGARKRAGVLRVPWSMGIGW